MESPATGSESTSSETEGLESLKSEGSVEVSAADVEGAIEQGLLSLGIAKEEALIEILDEGSAGFLGIGSRDASIKISVKRESNSDQDLETRPEVEIFGSESPPKLEQLAEPEEAGESLVEGDQPQDEKLAIRIIDQLLSKMDLDTTTTLRQTDPDEVTGDRRWVVDVKGDDLGILIGSRGDTLNAFQFVARLMTGHQTHRRSNFLIDVEGYRERREQAVARLAERMASKAISRGSAVILEPMPPNERRIIHITLRQNSGVFTESTDEGRQRRVQIIPSTESSEEENLS